MNKSRLALAIAALTIAPPTWAELITDKTEIRNGEPISVSAQFATTINGDLYVAVKIDDNYIFLQNDMTFSGAPIPFITNTTFSGSEPIFDNYPSEGIPGKVYSLYQVVTETGKSPFFQENWLSELSVLDISINM